jgi:sterol 3beta-glucosyltransferase
MKVLILTIGSRGDVQPYVALGKGLKAAGHEVVVATASSFESFVLDHKLGFFPMSNGLVDLLSTDMGRKALEDTRSIFGAVKTYIRLFKTIKPIGRELMRDSWDAAKDSDPDFIVYNSKVPGAHIAERLGVPCALAMPFPQLVSSKELPTLGLPELGPFNKASYGIVRLFMGIMGGFVNEFRTKTLGLKKGPRFMGLHHLADGTPVPVLHGYSRHVMPGPSDWPDNVHITGYWFLDDNSKPSQELVDFLDKGEPPVYIGFGSMSGRKPEKVSATVVEALEKAGVRGIIATGWGGLEADDLPDSILKIDQAPHEWLFPKVSAVVHHGGAGTTAAGLRAGRPTIICPFFGDQPFWGQRMVKLGVGSKPIPQRRLTADKLAAAIREVISNPDIRKAAATLGDTIRSENGVVKAVEIVEGLVSKKDEGD